MYVGETDRVTVSALLRTLAAKMQAVRRTVKEIPTGAKGPASLLVGRPGPIGRRFLVVSARARPLRKRSAPIAWEKQAVSIAVFMSRTLSCAPRRYLCALTRKNRLEVVVPYVPGRAAVQLAKSTLDSKMMVTGPPPSLGITTELLGVKEPKVVAGDV